MNKKSSNYKCSFGHLSVFSERISLYPFFFFFLKLKSTKRLRPTICYSMTQHPFSFGVFGTQSQPHSYWRIFPAIRFLPLIQNLFPGTLSKSCRDPEAFPGLLVWRFWKNSKQSLSLYNSYRNSYKVGRKKKDNPTIWHRWSHHRLNYVQLCPLSKRFFFSFLCIALCYLFLRSCLLFLVCK